MYSVDRIAADLGHLGTGACYRSRLWAKTLGTRINHHRGHTSLKGQSPIDRVPNLSGQNS
ncbi:hypothetical protein [Calidifontibacter indicus]|uniref:hypothetical protein n=1 Tax=Calidifontibacter indicus TaxID=419650 RepID=UPI003D73F8B0